MTPSKTLTPIHPAGTTSSVELSCTRSAASTDYTVPRAGATKGHGTIVKGTITWRAND